MIKHLLIFAILCQAKPILCQIVVKNLNKVYTESFYSKDGKCFCSSSEVDSSLMVESEDRPGFLSLNLLDLQHNMKSFKYDEEENLIFRYGKHSGAIRLWTGDINREDERIVREAAKDNPYLDTIFITRNIPGTTLLNKKDEPVFFYTMDMLKKDPRIYSKNTPYQKIKLIIVNNTDAFPYYRRADIEFKAGDGISRIGYREIFCPEDIDSGLAQLLNERLIEFGYLTEKKRKLYYPEIREALYKFQKEYSLETGFLDRKTLEYLDIEIK